MPCGATIMDTRTTPPRTASASEQAENSSKLERSHPLGLSGAAPRPQIGSRCWKLGWIEGYVRSLIKVLYCFHQNNDDSKCEVAHTFLPIRPSKSPADWY